MRHSVQKLAAWLLLATLLVALRSALAVTILTPNRTDYADRLARAVQAIRDREVGSYGMVPIYGRDIEDGTYEIKVESTSVFFKIIAAELTVSGDEMTARITIGSHSYLYVYMGTAEQAGHAPEEEWIPGDAGQRYTMFTIPVPALNAPFECAAYSKNRQLWYDRQLLIDASALPEGALAFELPDYALAEKAVLDFEPDGEAALGDEAPETVTPALLEPVSLPRSDGEYSIEVNLAGGSGRANVSSPTLLIIREGKAWARLLWSSPYYDYMVVGETIYENLTTDGGNSTFEIPITAMDAPMQVIADTTAMGDPLEIEYTLTFYSESLGDKSQIPQEAAKKVLYISLAIIVVGGILNHFVKKKRK
ncbi:MAG: hypothetical protein Q4C10_04290 [Clostridia bacterium]|nr:hypothetical protein [Clostridia bacterium]